MNLLHVINTCDPSTGGPIEGIKQFYKNFKINGIKPEILCSDSPKQKFNNHTDLPKIHALGPGKFKFAYNPKLKNWLNKNIKNYDHVIVHGIWQYHNYAVWKIAKKFKKPYYIFPHGMLDPWFDKSSFIKKIKKFIYWKFIQSKILQGAESLLFTSIDDKYLSRQSYKSYNFKEKVVGYGIAGNPNKFTNKNNLFLKNYPGLKSKKIILFFGRIDEKKGVDLLIKAFKRLHKIRPNLHLVIAGPYQPKYVNFLKKTLLQKSDIIKNSITWTGALYDKLKWDTLNTCHFFCLPSHQENFGISIVEAMSCKKPVIITNKVNIYRAINKYKAGYVSNDDEEGIFLSLKKITNLNYVDYQRKSENAYHCYKKNFYSINTSKKLINLLKKY